MTRGEGACLVCGKPLMMKQIEADYAREKLLMDDLKARGKEKSATCRQYMGNQLMYTKFLAIYKAYGLRD